MAVAMLVAVLMPLCASAGEVENTEHTVALPDSVGDVPQAVIEQLETDDVDLVIVGNDTISIILPEKNYGRSDRGICAYLFVPKGQFSFGLQASYGEISTDDLQMLNLISNLNFSAKSYSVKPHMSYFYKHNKEVGVRFGLSSTDFDLKSLSADIMDDISFDMRDRCSDAVTSDSTADAVLRSSTRWLCATTAALAPSRACITTNPRNPSRPAMLSDWIARPVCVCLFRKRGHLTCRSAFSVGTGSASIR